MAASSSRLPRRDRDQHVFCSCYGRCTHGVGPVRRVIARTRQAHLDADLQDLRSAQELGLEPSPLLVEAIRLNQASIDGPQASSSARQLQDEDLPDDDFGDDEDVLGLPHGSQLGDHGLDFSQFNDDDFDPPQFDQDALAAHRSASSSPAHPPSSIAGAAGPTLGEDYGSERDSAMEDRRLDCNDFDSQEELEDGDQDEELRSSSARSGSDSRSASGSGSDSEQGQLYGDQVHLFADTSSSNSDTDEGRSQAGTDAREGSDDGHPHEEHPPDRGTESRHGQDLFDQLVGNYDSGPRPTRPPPQETSVAGWKARLTQSEKETLKHIRTSIRTGATDEQYRQFARDKQDSLPGVTISDKHSASSLLRQATGLYERTWDMCPESCMAFVGPNAHLRRCNSIRKGVRCRRERYDAKGKPLRQYTTLPVVPRVRASFAAGKGSTHLHQTAELADHQWDTDAQRFKDWGWGAVHRNFREKGMFMDDRSDAFLLSVDGAQMVDNKRKSSNGWIVLLSSFNTPQLARFKRDEAFIATVIPGPNNPVNIDSFLWPVFEEFARAA
ncbi:hypothetical protein CF326_g4616, partial [Tilletia indica]